MTLPQNDLLAIPDLLAEFVPEVDQLRAVGREFYQKGWSVGTSSNYSLVLSRNPLELLVTASGMDKGRLRRRDFVRVNSQGTPIAADQPKSSAETMLHVAAAEQPNVGAVLHTHSPWATLLSDLYFSQGFLEFTGYEMLKGLDGVTTHEHTQRIWIFENTQEIPELAAEVRRRMNDAAAPLTHGYLIRRHGLYTWGRDLEEARRHIEIFEFLFECEARRIMLAAPALNLAGH